ncbi:hypothetical protein C8J57DRAFT_209040 [Mycena rebaudengoi]|nr:hypothetical protein C8J57DRAFT_209040 [Mycena rebaudengoi]
MRGSRRCRRRLLRRRSPRRRRCAAARRRSASARGSARGSLHAVYFIRTAALLITPFRIPFRTPTMRTPAPPSSVGSSDDGEEPSHSHHSHQPEYAFPRAPSQSAGEKQREVDGLGFFALLCAVLSAAPSSAGSTSSTAYPPTTSAAAYPLGGPYPSTSTSTPAPTPDDTPQRLRAQALRAVEQCFAEEDAAQDTGDDNNNAGSGSGRVDAVLAMYVLGVGMLQQGEPREGVYVHLARTIALARLAGVPDAFGASSSSSSSASVTSNNTSHPTANGATNNGTNTTTNNNTALWDNDNDGEEDTKPPFSPFVNSFSASASASGAASHTPNAMNTPNGLNNAMNAGNGGKKRRKGRGQEKGMGLEQGEGEGEGGVGGELRRRVWWALGWVDMLTADALGVQAHIAPSNAFSTSHSSLDAGLPRYTPGLDGELGADDGRGEGNGDAQGREGRELRWFGVRCRFLRLVHRVQLRTTHAPGGRYALEDAGAAEGEVRAWLAGEFASSSPSSSPSCSAATSTNTLPASTTLPFANPTNGNPDVQIVACWLLRRQRQQQQRTCRQRQQYRHRTSRPRRYRHPRRRRTSRRRRSSRSRARCSTRAWCAGTRLCGTLARCLRAGRGRGWRVRWGC